MINDEAEKHKMRIISKDEFINRKNFGIIFVRYSLYLAIVINIEIRIERTIKVFDIISIDDISVMLLRVVYGGIRSMFMIIRVIIGIKMCQ